MYSSLPPWSRVRLLLALLLAVAGVSAAATVVHTAAHAYDAPSLSRVEAEVVMASVLATPRLGQPVAGYLGHLKQPTGEPGGPTTRVRSFIATNNVKAILDALPRGKQGTVRTVESDAALQALFDQLSAGGTALSRPSYDGQWYRLDDGCEVGLRNSSVSGGRTIDVRSADGTARWKVHIE